MKSFYNRHEDECLAEIGDDLERDGERIIIIIVIKQAKRRRRRRRERKEKTSNRPLFFTLLVWGNHTHTHLCLGVCQASNEIQYPRRQNRRLNRESLTFLR
jgi:hypothetical protein